MLNMPARLILFFSSYTPLAVIFIILYLGRSWPVVVLASLGAATGLCGLIWIMYRARVDVAPASAVVVDFRQCGDDVMGYVAAYLIPFVGFSLTDLRQGIALLVFLLVLAYLYVTTDMLHINPMLQILGFHVYDVTFEASTVRRVITRSALRRGELLQLVPLSGDLQIGRERP